MMVVPICQRSAFAMKTKFPSLRESCEKDEGNGLTMMPLTKSSGSGASNVMGPDRSVPL